MIERAQTKVTTWAGDSGRFSGPGADERLHAVLAETERAGVLPAARTGIALKSMASGVSVAELARRAGVLDVEGAEIRELLAQAAQDRAKSTCDRARTERIMGELR